ncbi:MAG TPA: NAD(+) diphosphatase [Burkholderiales bacterium]|nr:NAD(+) diphosphatase [Burkholderiales bacterium]
MPSLYTPHHREPAERSGPALWFAFAKTDLVVCEDAGTACLPCCAGLAEHGFEGQRPQYLGRYDGRDCYAVEIDDAAQLPEGWRRVGLREAFALFEPELAALSGRAYQILDWDRNHQYCGRCGTPTVKREDERARTCPTCRRTSYPPISPAIMVLITDGASRVLLARKAGWPAGRYSALAGFVEPGEMLEDTIARETREEVGVEITNIRYFGSQPWPFPHSLMIAFTAEYAGGEVKPDGVEIEEARWFDVAELPTLPASISISRRLIDTITTGMRAAFVTNSR